jgi:hypothetical protein
MDFAPGERASKMVWDREHEHLSAATAFYDRIAERVGNTDDDEIMVPSASNTKWSRRDASGASGPSAIKRTSCGGVARNAG